MSATTAVSERTRFTTLRYAGIVVLAVLVLYWPTFQSMAAIWSRDATFAHGYVIPLISLWLLWQRRAQLTAVSIAFEPRGLLACAVLMLGWLLADLTDVQVVRQAAATALLPAALWAALGTQFLRCAAFPLAYLAFAVPWGDAFVPALVRFTTEFTVTAVRLVGVPIYSQDNMFSLPSGNFEVIKACSGVRYLMASLALGTLYAGISFRSWRRRLMFMVLSTIVPIIANGVRAFGIVMIAHLSGMRYAVGVDHLFYGWLFFGVVMMLLFWIGNRLVEPVTAAAPVTTSAAPQNPQALANMVTWRTAVAVALVLSLGPAMTSWLRAAAQPPQIAAATRLPTDSSVWHGPLRLQDEWRPAFMERAAAVGARYDSAGGSVLLFARDYAREVEAESALTGRALVAQEQGPWRVRAGNDVQLSATRVRSAHVSSDSGERLEVWVWYLINGEPVGGPVRAKWQQLLSWLSLVRPISSIVAVAAPAMQGADPHALLNDFLEQHPQLLGSQP